MGILNATRYDGNTVDVVSLMADEFSGKLKSKIYTDATYTYVCEADIGIDLTDSEWRVTRVHLTEGSRDFANAGKFDRQATDLTTVQGYTYS